MKTEAITMRVTPVEKEFLKEQAEKQDCSISYLVRQLIKDYIKEIKDNDC